MVPQKSPNNLLLCPSAPTVPQTIAASRPPEPETRAACLSRRVAVRTSHSPHDASVGPKGGPAGRLVAYRLRPGVNRREPIAASFAQNGANSLITKVREEGGHMSEWNIVELCTDGYSMVRGQVSVLHTPASHHGMLSANVRPA